MRSNRRCLNAFLVVVGTVLPGCLSLGGKTVYTNDSPQTANRLSTLEDRVNVLEQAVAGRAAVPPPPDRPKP